MSVGPESEPVEEVKEAELSPDELFTEIIRIRDARDVVISAAHVAAHKEARGIVTPSYEGAAAALLELFPDVCDRLVGYRQEDQARAQKPIRRVGMTMDTNSRTMINALIVAAKATDRTFNGDFQGTRFSVDPGSVPEEVWKSAIQQQRIDDEFHSATA